MADWRRLTEDEPWVAERSLTLLDSLHQEVYFYVERVDEDGKVVDREGETKLKPIMDLSVKIQESDPDDFDEDAIKEKAAPLICKVIGELTNDEIDPEEFMEGLNIQMDGSWSATRPGELSHRKKPQIRRIH